MSNGSFISGYEAYWRRTTDEIEQAIRSSAIVLDTNALLNLYRMASDGRAEYLAVLEHVADRLWVPRQVVDEFHKVRLSAVASHIAGLKTKSDAVSVAAEALKAALKDFARLYSLANGRVAEYMEPLDSAIAGILQHVSSDVEAFDLDPSDLASSDPILDRLADILDGKVGDGIETKDLAEIMAEAKRRGQEKIPPGYKDWENKGEEGVGDFLIWREMLSFAKSGDRGILFVSTDVKEDWFRRQAGFVIGPRPELVKEMRDEAGSAYQHLTLADFLRKASTALGVFVSPNTINRAKELESDHSLAKKAQMIEQLEQTRRARDAARADKAQRIHELDLLRDHIRVLDYEAENLKDRANMQANLTKGDRKALEERLASVYAERRAAEDHRAQLRAAVQMSEDMEEEFTAILTEIEVSLSQIAAY
jgi:rRNA-processing protein FCF1